MAIPERFHIPLSVRQRIGIPPGALPMVVRFGATDPLDMPGGYRYEISAADREIFERAVRDARSGDYDRSRMAREALLDTMNAVPIYGPLLRLGGEQIFNMLGFGVRADISLGAEGGGAWFSEHHYDLADAGDLAMAAALGSSSANVQESLGAHYLIFNASANRNPKSWSRSPGDTGVNDGSVSWASGGFNGTPWGLLKGKIEQLVTTQLGGARQIRLDAPSGSLIFEPSQGLDGVDTAAPTDGSNPDLNRPKGLHGFPASLSARIDLTGRYLDDRKTGTEIQVDTSPVGIRSAATQEDPDWFTLYGENLRHAPPTGESYETEEFVIDHIPVWPGMAASWNLAEPDMTFEDLEGIGDLDPDFSDITPPEMQGMIDDVKLSPWHGQYAGLPDPTDPGTPTVPAPGNPIVPTDPLDPGMPPDPDMPADPDVPGPGLPNPGFTDLANPRMNFPGPGAGGPSMDFDIPDCQPALPGEPVSADMGGKQATGKVGRYEPGGSRPGEPCRFIAPIPPFTDEYFSKARCYKNKLAVEIARELAIELGMNPATLITEPGCDETFTGCFKKGSSKFDAMWAMLDLCGFGMFPDPDEPVIGEIKPLNVHHGPYHEDVAVFQYERAYDDLDMPSHIEYYRPPYRNPDGTIKQRYSTGPIPVVTDYELPFDKWETHIAPRHMSNAAMDAAAQRRATEAGARGNVAIIAVPFKATIGYRHQIKVLRPSRGFDANYMVISLRHDFAEDGYLTIVEGRELEVWNYAPVRPA